MAKTKDESNAITHPSYLSNESSMMNECDLQKEDFEILVGELRDSLGHYLRKRPVIASSLVFLAGFYVGWKIKPW